MAHVEREIRIAMEDILRDWQAYCTTKSKAEKSAAPPKPKNTDPQSLLF